jgi:hypothetical protein
MTAGWGGSALRLALGERLPVGAEELAELCRFYDGVAGDLLAAFEAHGRIN